ncbi:hypothetical protein MSEO_32480 [Mycobacterium seoulense]|uniref:Uncharacterized protein n=1 Tax=Mycobacterium seoulense TaxID=386911 RepID=A0A7I7P233_9MYCO|nr:hypothetical protein MSEO_32480 [Mycobacterium seoulense]
MPGIVFEFIPDMELGVVNVALVMTHRPFGGLFGTDWIGPPEPHHARTDTDAEPSGLRFDPATPRTSRPRWRWLE